MDANHVDATDDIKGFQNNLSQIQENLKTLQDQQDSAVELSHDTFRFHVKQYNNVDQLLLKAENHRKKIQTLSTTIERQL